MSKAGAYVAAAAVTSVLCIAAAAVMARSRTDGATPGAWRPGILVALLAVSVYCASRAFMITFKKVNRQIRWGDTVAVIEDAPDGYHPGAQGVVRDIRYLGRMRACLVEFVDGTTNVVPDRFLTLVTPGEPFRFGQG